MIEDTLRIAFFPGCLIPVKYPQFEVAIRKTLPNIGVEIVDLEGLTCCPDPIYFKSTNKLDWLTIAARNLTIAESAELDFFTICSGCTATLSEAKDHLKEDPELAERINERLAKVGREYKGTSKVRHIVTVLRDSIGIERVAESVKVPLTGLNVAIHYGCHLLKPSGIMHVDDPDYPHVLDDLVSALGATPVVHRERILCCGKACKDENMPADMMFDLLSSVEEVSADCMGVICPSCFNEFDLGQIILARERGHNFQIPITYFFQLLGLAQGFSAREMGLDRHKIKADPRLWRGGAEAEVSAKPKKTSGKRKAKPKAKPKAKAGAKNNAGKGKK